MPEWKHSLLTQKETSRLYQMGAEMVQAGLSPDFVHETIELARRSRAGFELMSLWTEADTPAFKGKVVVSLQSLLDDEAELGELQEPLVQPITHRQADALVTKIRQYKDWLRGRVDRWGGVTKLATATGMPQPSVSEFFRSNSLPKRTTIERIRLAIGLSEQESVPEWLAPPAPTQRRAAVQKQPHERAAQPTRRVYALSKQGRHITLKPADAKIPALAAGDETGHPSGSQAETSRLDGPKHGGKAKRTRPSRRKHK